MIETEIFNVALYVVALWVLFYGVFCAVSRRWIRLDAKPLVFHVFLFSALGVAGEEFVNTLYALIFGQPLWEYRLYPTQNGNLTYAFVGVWGTLGFYCYLRSRTFGKSLGVKGPLAGVILGTESVFIEILVNYPFRALFGEYIFYYFPANLGYFSHYSCLQVIPFYIIVGYVTTRLIAQQEEAQYRYLRVNLGFYVLVMTTVAFI